MSYIHNGGSYNPFQKDAKCPKDFDYFQFLNISEQNESQIIYFRYFEPMNEYPQYILPFVKVSCEGQFELTTFKYDSFKNISFNDGIFSFQLSPQISGEKTFDVSMCGRSMYRAKHQVRFNTYVVGTTIIDMRNSRYMIDNFCIANESIHLFFAFDVTLLNNHMIEALPLTIHNTTMTFFARQNNFSVINESVNYININKTGVNFLLDMSFGFSDTNNKTFYFENISQSEMPKNITKLNISLFSQPTCFSQAEFQGYSQLPIQRQVFGEKHANSTKVVISSSISKHFPQYESINTEKCSFEELYKKISDARVFVGCTDSDKSAAILMGREDTAFIDIQPCFEARHFSPLNPKTKAKVLSGNRYRLCRNGANVEEIENIITDIILNNENSPLLE